MPVLNTIQKTQFPWSEKQCIIYRPDLHILQTSRKKVWKVANGWNQTFYQCQNQKYIQTSLMLKFPNISKVCLIYRLYKKQENG